MNGIIYSVLIVLVMAAVTAGIRFSPFIIFSGGRKTPAVIDYLGKVLPGAVMAMLVVYCLKGVSFSSFSTFVPELTACLITVFIHIWKRSTLLSIICGTAVYMFLVQAVF